jgi:hypothetical protein
MLDHPMLLALLTNQHHNLTHPKLLSLPRGMPTYLAYRKVYLWDIMRKYSSASTLLRKDSLMFASNSNWKHRPYISKCIAQKFVAEEKQAVSGSGGATKGGIGISDYGVGEPGKGSGSRLTHVEYYRKIASSRTSVTLAGLGYDSFR